MRTHSHTGRCRSAWLELRRAGFPRRFWLLLGQSTPTVWGGGGLTINTAAGGSNPPQGARGAGHRWAAASRGRCPGSTGGRCAQASRRAGRWRPGVITRERGAYRTAEAGTRTQYVQYVGPWGQAALRLRYVPNAGGWYCLLYTSPSPRD